MAIIYLQLYGDLSLRADNATVDSSIPSLFTTKTLPSSTETAKIPYEKHKNASKGF